LCVILVRMTAWKDVEEAAPEFAERVRKIFDAHKHKTIATLRADGGPRISGIEAEFADGELTFGSMTGARKGADLRRDPRFALHSPSVNPPEDNPAGWAGDAKIAGRAVPAGPVGEGADGELFRADIDEVVVTCLNAEATKLVIESWTPGRGLRRVERE
jgi:Pyridoxamine 5'-phosphate oxidase